MLYYLESLRSTFGPFRLFEYVTFRAGGALLTAMLIVLIFGKPVIGLLKKFCIANWRYENLLGEQEGEELKKKTPTMGGILLVAAVLISTLLWGVMNRMLIIFLCVLCSLCVLGFVDDFIKIRYKRNIRDGVPGKVKMLVQFLIALSAAYFLYKTPEAVTMQLYIPFFKDPVIAQPDVDSAQVYLMTPFSENPLLALGIAWTTLFVGIMLVFNGLVVTGTSNAVNLTDGKDGLAAGCLMFCSLAFAAFAYMSSHAVFAKYLSIPLVPSASEVSVFACAIAGACIGFLWFNCNPASVFMGDTGSLPLGGVLGLIAVLIGQQLLLLIVGFVFVMEAVSVILQVYSFKWTGKRIFRCTPIHHHFEMKGWSENQIVIRFWLIAGICALLGLATLKLH
ncbi:MAG: phospho-N-acetylmuramoyl-pentapeptide-transferase [Lentisphaerae bacterium]|nr:phospho-N-acetylmuramoyl-pentapeptide-transferase [Lentisphaerota bacterium]